MAAGQGAQGQLGGCGPGCGAPGSRPLRNRAQRAPRSAVDSRPSAPLTYIREKATDALVLERRKEAFQL